MTAGVHIAPDAEIRVVPLDHSLPCLRLGPAAVHVYACGDVPASATSLRILEAVTQWHEAIVASEAAEPFPTNCGEKYCSLIDPDRDDVVLACGFAVECKAAFDSGRAAL